MPNLTLRNCFIAIVLLLMGGFTIPAPGQDPDSAAPPTEQGVDHKHTNRLINQTSPYLLQHAHNPVDWYSWGPEAFAAAKAENKPIFLSVGYSTCYWCHVMERESFERDDVAAIINQHYIAIKVDREERPEVDQQYMMATQLVTQRGGWPNSVWLTPDGKAWMAGTYFPREQFKQALLTLADVWETRRDEVDRQAAAITAAIERRGNAVAATKPISQLLIDQAVQASRNHFDPQHGGFGGAPKFPPHDQLALLIDQYRRQPDESLGAIIEKTLTEMSRGGVYDQIGGGFHRYSTDDHWLLPHFEKMLYDNAQLMRSYTDGFLISQNEAHKTTIAGVFDWLSREMTSPQGGFYSAVDSESDAEEGKFYVWTLAEIIAALGESEGKRFANVYQVSDVGNFHEESTGKLTGNNVLHRNGSIADYANEHELDAVELRQQLADQREKLLQVRQQREYPHLDDKVLAAWNGLMIEGLAYAGRQLDQPQYTAAAQKAADFILDEMVIDGKLQRTYRSGKASLDGYLTDYAFVISGLIQLYRATEQKRYLDAAQSLGDTAIKLFQDDQNGGFFFTEAPQPNDISEFLIRTKNLAGGGNLPSGNGVMAQALLQLTELTAEAEYADAARRAVTGLSGSLWQSAGQPDHLLIAAAMILADPQPSTPPRKSGFRTAQLKGAVSVSESKLRPGQSFELTVTLDIQPGWHLYAANPGIDFIQPTRLRFADQNAADVKRIIAPKGAQKQDPVFDQSLAILQGQVKFNVQLEIPEDASPGKASLALTVDVQACDDTQCARPQSHPLEIEIEIISAKTP
ncbi:DUF255 domain-containing protein [Stieleria sp. TO1_6]|uniref:DUF255 domain-containing protein n=1 Tax=Stieleria tagensis TaxID=2956795 RepID=UPI00209AA3A6|nr:DUF255 domain-containing protein [Stieleria tagensis]MCO8122182.1 DUF255 domain-containing protein [Stieleria tagensis]